MNLDALKNYRKWLEQSPREVLRSVKDVAGNWDAVFPKGLPRWASKVRNYFNATPRTLKRVPQENAKTLTRILAPLGFELDCYETQSFNRSHIDHRPNPWGKPNPPAFPVPHGCPAKPSEQVKDIGFKDSIAIKSALSGDVYLDERGRTWFQMSPGAAIYHWGREPMWAAFEAFWQSVVRGQNDTPVFKLISPDNNSGSCEVILLNDGVSAYTSGGGGETIGKVNEVVDISNILLTDPAYQGSYNYSETMVVGLADHQLRDVRPHVPGRRFYVNPDHPLSELTARTFPPNDLDGNPLADQTE